MLVTMKIENDDFLKWLSKRIDKRHFNVVKALQSNTKIAEIRHAVFNTWHEHSVVAIDGQNGRDQVKMREIEYLRKYEDLLLPSYAEIEFYTSKRGQHMVCGTRCISTKNGCQIQVKLAEIGFKVSYGTIINLKPFYVQKPAERKKESCLCKFCLNLHVRFNELNNLLIDK